MGSGFERVLENMLAGSNGIAMAQIVLKLSENYATRLTIIILGLLGPKTSKTVLKLKYAQAALGVS